MFHIASKRSLKLGIMFYTQPRQSWLLPWNCIASLCSWWH